MATNSPSPAKGTIFGYRSTKKQKYFTNAMRQTTTWRKISTRSARRQGPVVLEGVECMGIAGIYYKTVRTCGDGGCRSWDKLVWLEFYACSFILIPSWLSITNYTMDCCLQLLLLPTWMAVYWSCTRLAKTNQRENGRLSISNAPVMNSSIFVIALIKIDDRMRAAKEVIMASSSSSGSCLGAFCIEWWADKRIVAECLVVYTYKIYIHNSLLICDEGRKRKARCYFVCNACIRHVGVVLFCSHLLEIIYSACWVVVISG